MKTPAKEAIYDLDGDPNTTNDQGIYQIPLAYLKKNPQYDVNANDSIRFRQDSQSIENGFLYANNIVAINGRNVGR
jgi:hypothetical protein